MLIEDRGGHLYCMDDSMYGHVGNDAELIHAGKGLAELLVHHSVMTLLPGNHHYPVAGGPEETRGRITEVVGVTLSSIALSITAG
jgi:hypothetical protein